MQVTIRVTGPVQQLTALRALGEAGRAVNGPIATWGSTLPYAQVIETGRRYGRPWRKAGPALMFQRGIAATLPAVPGIMLPSIEKGAASVGQAKRKVRDLGIENIRKLTPVRSGRLRASVRELTRPA
jgi:hypothetical protein